MENSWKLKEESILFSKSLALSLHHWIEAMEHQSEPDPSWVSPLHIDEGAKNLPENLHIGPLCLEMSSVFPVTPSTTGHWQGESQSPWCSWWEECTLLDLEPINHHVIILASSWWSFTWSKTQAWTLFPRHSSGPCWHSNCQPSSVSVN